MQLSEPASCKEWELITRHQGEEELQLRTFSKETANYVVHQVKGWEVFLLIAKTYFTVVAPAHNDM